MVLVGETLSFGLLTLPLKDMVGVPLYDGICGADICEPIPENINFILVFLQCEASLHNRPKNIMELKYYGYN